MRSGREAAARLAAGLGAALALGAAAAAGAAEPLFVEAAAASGLDFVYDNGATGELWIAEITGPGGALVDYDGDGDLDVYLVEGGSLATGAPAVTDRLFRNDSHRDGGGEWVLRFVDVTARTGLAPGAYGMGVAAGDFDGDGWVDLYVTNLGPNQLLRNLGDGTFADVTAAAGADDSRWSVSATFFDYDRDGWLDLWVANYLDFTPATSVACQAPNGVPDYCGPAAYRPVGDRLFRNRGDGTFADASASAPIEARAGLGVVAADFDANGWPDVYVANDKMANQLYLNQGDGTFREEALLAGCGVNAEGAAEASMGVGIADVDGDGDEDLFVTHLTQETSTLYLNEGDGLFRDGTEASGLGSPTWGYTSFGTAFLDYENDGRLDLVAVNGAVSFFTGGSRQRLEQRNQLFRNLDGRRFHEVTAEAGAAFALEEVSRGAPVGDVDNDGDTDVLVVNNSSPVRLLVNRVGQDAGWVGLRAVERPGGADVLGARVAVERAADGRLWRRTQADGSFASAGDPRVVFGLGESRGARAVVVHWPDGGARRLEGLPAGRYFAVSRTPSSGS